MSKKKKLILWISIALAVLLIAGVAAFLLLRNPAGGKNHTQHDFSQVQVIRPQSCTESGVTAHVCSCGKEELEILPATGHKFGDWTTEKEATCSETGTKQATCSVCSAKQTEALPRLAHSYTQAQSQPDDKTVRYVCVTCNDTFAVNAEQEVDLLSARYQSDCTPDHTFRIYCPQDEQYIREHLYITNAYYHNTDKQTNLEYQLSGEGGGYWSVSPVTPYAAGNIYVAGRSGEVLFGDMTVRDMKFQIHREESNEMVLRKNVKFLQELENKRSGYYPYTLDYVEQTQTYWLTLNKANGLEVGDVICVGDATCLDDVLAKTGKQDVFGKITFMRFDEKTGKYCIELASPELSDLFSSLNVHSKTASMLGTPKLASAEEMVDQAAQLLYQDDDFATLMCAVQDTSVTYLEARGYATPLSSVEDFFGAIKIVYPLKDNEKDDGQERSVLPYVDENGVFHAKIVVHGEVPVPITLTKDSDEQLGEIKFYFTAIVSLDSMQVIVTLDDTTIQLDGKDKAVNAQVGVDQQVTVGFTMGVEVQMDWSLSSKPYAINKSTKALHFATCKHVAAIKNPQTELEMITAEDFFTRLSEEKISVKHECGTCLPVTSLLSDSLVINTETKVVHLPDCPQAKKLKSSKAEVSDLPLANILAKDPACKECENCQPSNRATHSFTDQVLKTMRSKDLGDNLETFKKMAEESGNSAGANTLTLATVPFTVTGFDTIELELGVYFDLHLEATLEYNYELQINSQYGIYLDSRGFAYYSTSDKTPLRNDLTLTGKARADVGLQATVDLHVVGLEKYCYAKLMARAGLYAEIHGAVRYDFLTSHPEYASVYFESGLHLDLLVDARIFLYKSEERSLIPKDIQDIPFLCYGFERLYYNFDQMPDKIDVDRIYYNLEDANILNVKYFDIVTMTEGTDKLNILGVKDKYTVEFSLKDGTNCSVADGYLRVNTPYMSFSDELTITVTGADKWGKFRKGNTEYNIGSYTIPIHYDATTADPNAQYAPAGGLEYNGHYYKLYTGTAATWEDAKAYCESRGGYLAVISSPEEDKALFAYLQSLDVETAYFGLYEDADGQWRWVENEKSEYFNWGEEEPNNEGGVENYGQYYYVYPNGEWNDGGYGHATINDSLSFICEWETYEFAPEHSEDLSVSGRLDALVGHYHGWYTAIQGITDGSIGVHRTNALLEDEAALQWYADYATKCTKDSQGNITKTFTAEDIRKIVEKHTDEYIAIFMFGPRLENPDVEDGLYTMSVTYDESTGTYTLIGSEWIQRDTYVFVDLKGLSLGGNVIMSSVFYTNSNTKHGTLYQERYVPDYLTTE